MYKNLLWNPFQRIDEEELHSRNEEEDSVEAGLQRGRRDGRVAAAGEQGNKCPHAVPNDHNVDDTDEFVVMLAEHDEDEEEADGILDCELEHSRDGVDGASEQKEDVPSFQRSRIFYRHFPLVVEERRCSLERHEELHCDHTAAATTWSFNGVCELSLRQIFALLKFENGYRACTVAGADSKQRYDLIRVPISTLNSKFGYFIVCDKFINPPKP